MYTYVYINNIMYTYIYILIIFWKMDASYKNNFYFLNGIIYFFNSCNSLLSIKKLLV